ncbi:hypothetical protein M0R72_00515 [Candidatus Pacearchaeota archaeon]|jgi:hypothetical protein|nr:hypothetical protein [Candidatus Pacearchaeota archaeon]
MKTADAYAYHHAQVGDQFVSFLTIKIEGRKTATVGKHTVVEVTSAVVRLDNGIALSRTTGKVVGVTNQPRANMPSYFPATTANMARAIRSQG